MEAIEDLQEAVATAMANIVAGDKGSLWDLHRLAAPSLERMFRGEARRIGVWLSDDDVFELTLDAVDVLRQLSRGWKPGAALPWVWARRRILSQVHQHIGQFTRELDDRYDNDPEPTPVSTSIDDPRAALRFLAGRYEAAQRLEAGLEGVTDRDADIYLRFRMEKAAGNRSPAVTVAADHGMQAAAVRKVVQRVSERLGPDVGVLAA